MQPQHESGESTVERTRAAAGEVAGTAKEQIQQVTHETGNQARHVVGQTRERLATEARNQSGRAAGNLRQWSDELASMTESSKPDSPVRSAVGQVADSGRKAADYLDRHGFEGAAGELQEFARRRPGAFLLGAAVAGFLVGRAAKAATQASTRESNQATGDGGRFRGQPPLGDVRTYTDEAPVAGQSPYADVTYPGSGQVSDYPRGPGGASGVS